MRKLLLLSIVGTMLAGSVYPFSKATVPGAVPVITTTSGYTEFETGKGPVIIDDGIMVTDEDSQKASIAVVKLVDRPDGGNEFISINPDMVDLAKDNGLTVNYDFTKGELTITGEADFSLYQRIFRKLAYDNVSAIPDIEDRKVEFTIYDADGHASSGQNRIIRIKNVQAAITHVSTVEDGLYGISQSLTVTLTFNRTVWINDRTPQMTVQIGEKTVNATYASGSGSKKLVFAYTVTEGELDLDGVAITAEIDLNGATISDSVNESANLDIDDFPDTSGIKVDGIRPHVVSVGLPEDRNYTDCGENRLEFSLTMSEAIVLPASATLMIVFDSGERQALLDAVKSTSEMLVFGYEVAPGDLDDNGIEIKALELNEGGIVDQAGNRLTDLALTKAEIAGQNGVIIDGSVPAPPQVAGIDPDKGDLSNDGITNISAIKVHGTAEPNLSVRLLANGEEVGEVDVDADGSWTFDTAGLDWEEGKYELAAVATDGSCNSSEVSETFTLTIDLTGPSVVTANKEVILGDNGEATVGITELVETFSDNFTLADEITLISEKDTFSCENTGENEIKITATDIAGNETVEKALVTVTHHEALAFVVEDLEISLDENGSAEISYSDLVKGLSGTCKALEDFTFELSKATFGCGDIGENDVVITVTGEDGSVNTLEASVAITDTIVPVVSGGEENIDIYADESGQYVMENYLEILNISDNCRLSMTDQFPAEGIVLSGYNTPHKVIITANDGKGNVTEYVFTITLKSKIIAFLSNPEILAVSWGTEIDELPLPSQVEGTLLSGNTVMVDVVWDIQHYENMEPGIYQNEGTLSLGSDTYSYSGERVPILTIMVAEKALPKDILLSRDEFSVEDDPNIPLGILSTVDPGDDQHTYALTGGEYVDERFFYIVEDRLFWSPDGIPDGQQEFVITVSSTDRMGNTITKTFTITRSKPDLDDLNISNVFSPNGDGINDDWGVSLLRFYRGVKLMVFERSGKMVFLTDDPQGRWDGRYEGADLPVGSYYYVIELGEERQKRRGVLTLIRN